MTLPVLLNLFATLLNLGLYLSFRNVVNLVCACISFGFMLLFYFN